MTAHLWQSTIFAAAAALLTLVFRRSPARVRHWLWLAASIKFLIPFSLLVDLGGRVQWRSAAAAPISYAMEDLGRQLSAPVVHFQAPEAGTRDWAAIGVAVWILGSAAVLLAWCVRWRRIRSAVRSSSSLRITNVPIPVRSSRTLVEPGVFGIFWPVLILPEGISDRLSPGQLDAIIAHELCHVRRRDNLASAIHMLVEALFWFHPLVWWIGARMVEERERACDEEVLEMGNEPEVYAESILKVCRFYVESPIECVSGVTGADLKKRIEQIMANRKICGLTYGRRLLLAAAAILVLTMPVVIGLFDVSRVRAQSAENPAFEVASVRLHVGGTDRNALVPPTALPGGRFVFRFPLVMLISYAYRLPFNLENGKLSGFPDWVGTAIYDVEATSAMPPGLSVQARDDRVRAMVQALLVDRFKLVMRRESKEMPVYALLVAKGGPRLQRADIDEKDCPEGSLHALGPQSPSTPIPDVCHAFNGGMGRGLHARAASMSDLAAYVENWTDRPLLNKTGIKGLYRFETKGWLPMGAGVDAGSSGVADRPTVFQMLEELGLRMEAQKGVVDVYVIEHIEKPSEN